MILVSIFSLLGYIIIRNKSYFKLEFIRHLDIIWRETLLIGYVR